MLYVTGFIVWLLVAVCVFAWSLLISGGFGVLVGFGFCGFVNWFVVAVVCLLFTLVYGFVVAVLRSGYACFLVCVV